MELNSSAPQRDKRTVILDSAGMVFARDGYEGASMSAITRDAGVSKATVYHHFTSKAELFGAFVHRECNGTLTPLFQNLTHNTDPAAALHNIGLRMINFLLSPAFLTIDRVVASEASTFPELAQAFYEAGPRQGVKIMAHWLQEQDAAGRLCVPDPEFAAEQFFALCQTRVVLRCRLRMGGTIQDDAIDRVVAGAVTMFLNTYGAPEPAPSGHALSGPASSGPASSGPAPPEPTP